MLPDLFAWLVHSARGGNGAADAVLSVALIVAVAAAVVWASRWAARRVLFW